MLKKMMFTELSSREEEMIRAALSGATDEMLSKELGVALPTVRSHWRTIRLKFGLQGRGEIVDLFRRSQTSIFSTYLAKFFRFRIDDLAQDDLVSLLNRLAHQDEPLAESNGMEEQLSDKRPESALSVSIDLGFLCNGEIKLDKDIKQANLLDSHVVDFIAVLNIDPKSEEILECLTTYSNRIRILGTTKAIQGAKVWPWFLTNLRLSSFVAVPSISLLPLSASVEFAVLKRTGISSCYCCRLPAEHDGNWRFVLVGFHDLAFVHRSVIFRVAYMALECEAHAEKNVSRFCSSTADADLGLAV